MTLNLDEQFKQFDVMYALTHVLMILIRARQLNLIKNGRKRGKLLNCSLSGVGGVVF